MAKITKRYIAGLKTSPRDIIHWDTDLIGFGLRVKPSGTQTYVIQYRTKNGSTRRYSLGKVGVLTPDEARQRARKSLLAASDGADPSGDRRLLRQDLTVSQLAARYLADAPADKPRKKASSWKTDRSNLMRHVVPVLGRKHLATLTRADVQRFQRDVTEGKTRTDEKTGFRGRAIVSGGAGTAARATVVLAAMLQWAVDQDMLSQNPARGVKLNRMEKRERFLSGDELASLGNALNRAEEQGINKLSIAALRLLILTGCRKSEILSLKWDNVDFERSALRLADSKTGAKIVPLGAPALEILICLKPKTNREFVFPASRGDGHLIGLPAIWRKVAALAKLKGVRMHDLRHGFASVAVAGGESLYVIGKVLGHTQAATTERYAHLQIDPMRAAADRVSISISKALEGKKPIR